MKKEPVTPLKEEFVSFETAKLAKEKGFDEFCRKCFNEKGESKVFSGYAYMKEYNKNSTVHFIDTNTEEFEYPSIVCTQPTQSLLQKWLREIPGISIKIDDYYTNCRIRFDYNVCELGSQEDNPVGVFETYEEALEVGLQEALKQIKP